MPDTPTKPVLLTGASGALGRHLTRFLAEAGWTLRLTDIAPFPDKLPPRAAFTRADLEDGVEILRLAEGCGLILWPWQGASGVVSAPRSRDAGRAGWTPPDSRFT